MASKTDRQFYDYLVQKYIAAGYPERTAKFWASAGVAERRQYKERQKNQPMSPGKQFAIGLGGTAATALTTAAALEAGKGLVGAFGEKAAEEAGKEAVKQGAQSLVNSAPTAAAEAAPTATESATLLSQAPAGAEVVGPDAGGFLGLGSSGYAAGMGATPAYIPAAIAIQAALSGKSAWDMLQGKEKRIDQMSMDDITGDPLGTAGRVGLAIATGGLSEIGNSLLSHKSTKDYEQERWGALQPELGQTAIDFAHKEGDPGVWQSGKYAGEKWSFDKALDLAREDPTNFIGVLGNWEAFGDKWRTTPLDKQKAIVNALIGENLYTSDKGDVLLRDKNRASAIYDSILNGTPLV